MKKTIIFLMLFVPLLSKAQGDTVYNGIKWETSLSWKQIKVKATEEKKYIMLDCYTTWCGPCKWMEQNVYPSQEVGNYFNQNFISVKVQMDTTKTDNELIRSWRNDAKGINEQYKVASFPTYLYFSPEGEIVHKLVGSLPQKLFIDISADALNPSKQYYSLLRNYQQGVRDTAVMKELAISTKSFGENKLALQIADDYLAILGERAFKDETDVQFMQRFKSSTNAQKIAKECINHLKMEELYTKKNIELMVSFMQSSKDKIFDILYHFGDRVNAIMENDDYAQDQVRTIIKNEEILPHWKEEMDNKKMVDWKKISKSIRQKYGNMYAQRCTLEGRVAVYQYDAKKFNTDWIGYIKFNIKLIDKYGTDTTNGMTDAIQLNNFAYDIFLHSNDKMQVNWAIELMKRVLGRHPNDGNELDTYANLLYKIGREKEGIDWEAKALKIAIDDKDDNFQRLYQEVLTKMKMGRPTWFQE